MRVLSRLRCWCEGENVTFYARVGNLSEGGLFLRTRTPLETGAITRLRLNDGPETVEATATVVWARADGQESGMGLRFEALDEPGRSQLRALIEHERSGLGPAAVE
jgi:uncharacterized protein (TIGR02266 family)